MESIGGDEFDLNWVCCLLDDIPNTCSDSFSMHPIVPLPISRLESFPSSTSHSVGNQDSCEGLDGVEECCRKRSRVQTEPVTASSSKASREKLRRDNVNKRFVELSAILESGTTPKFDKAAILSDAIRTVKLLREESSSLTSKNGELKQDISELKAAKNALRDEKRALVSEKEKIEQKIRDLDARSSWPFHPTSVPTSYAVPCQTYGGKLMPLVNYSSVPMWQFVPQTAVDTSQDHVLRPPVA